MIPQPAFHPNLISVKCQNIDDVRALAEEMRSAAIAEEASYSQDNPDEGSGKEYAASESVEVAIKKAKPVAEEMLEQGILRFMSYRGRMPVNICFSLRKTKEFSEWNLSLSHGTLEGPLRVKDDLAAVVIAAFLGDDFEEVPPKAVWDTVRHFVEKFDVA